jgi:hypothetical protein
MLEAVQLRISLFALAAVGCGSPWQAQMTSIAADHARAASCPTERVHVHEAPLKRWVGERVDSVPWVEPAAPPPAVTNDAERMALWQRDRDQQHADWETRRADHHPLTASDEVIFELDSCDDAQLWICGSSGHGGCVPIEQAFDAAGTLACPDGHAAERTGGTFACTARPAFNLASCVSACAPGAEEGACEDACGDAANAECRRDGFDQLRLCGRAAASR